MGGQFRCLSAPKGGRESCFSCQTPGTPITRGAAWTRREEFTGPVPPRCSKNVPPSPQGLLTSDPDLELLLNKISTVNHLLSSLEKKVPAPPQHWEAQLGAGRGTTAVNGSHCPALPVPRAGEPHSAPANPSPKLNPPAKQAAGGGTAPGCPMGQDGLAQGAQGSQLAQCPQTGARLPCRC